MRLIASADSRDVDELLRLPWITARAASQRIAVGEEEEARGARPLAANGHMQETLGLAFAGKHPLV